MMGGKLCFWEVLNLGEVQWHDPMGDGEVCWVALALLKTSENSEYLIRIAMVL